jgi:tRNA-binding protein
LHIEHEIQQEIAPEISFDHFMAVDIRVGTVLTAQELPNARNPSYILNIDMGEFIGNKKACAQITKNYNVEDLVGVKVSVVVNFKPRQIGKVMSEVLVLGFPDLDRNIRLITPCSQIPNGSRLS